MKNIFHSIGHVGWMSLNLLAVTGLLLADACVWLSPERTVLPALLGLGFEVLLWVNVVFAVSWLFSHRKSWCAVGIIGIALSAGNILNTYSHKSGETADKEHNISVLTYNTHQCSELKKAGKNEVLNYILESGADIVCMQEYEVRKDPYYLTFDEARNYLINTYPYTYYDFSIYNKRRQYGLAVYSKYPLINKTSLHYDSKGNQSNFCDAVIGKDTIRIFNNHLESNRLSHSDLEKAENIENTTELKRSTWTIVNKMISAYKLRAKESEAVRDAIKESPYPVIVAGDMNDVPVSYTYHTIANGLEDSWLHASIGKRGLTFYRKMLGVRIDYILMSKTMSTREAKVDKVGGSDHYPYQATICW